MSLSDKLHESGVHRAADERLEIAVMTESLVVGRFVRHGHRRIVCLFQVGKFRPKPVEDVRKEILVGKLSGFDVDRAIGAHVLAEVIDETVKQLEVTRVFIQKTVWGTVNNSTSLGVVMQEIEDDLLKRRGRRRRRGKTGLRNALISFYISLRISFPNVTCFSLLNLMSQIGCNMVAVDTCPPRGLRTYILSANKIVIIIR